MATGMAAGVDVRQSEVRWVRYDPAGTGTGRIRAGRVPQSNLGESLRAVATHLRPAGAIPVAAAVESRRVVVRHTVLPPMPAREVAPALAYQLPQLIPGYTDEWVHDYVPLPCRDADADRAQEYLVAALPRTVVLEYHDAFKTAGLRLMSLEIKALALWRFLFGAAVAGSDPATSVCLAVLDPDDSTADLAVFEGGGLRYTRLLAGWEADEAADRITARLVSEIEQSLLWYRDHRGGSPRVLLVAGDPGAACGAEVLTARLGLQAYAGGPAWAAVDGLNPAFATAAGLAFKGVVLA